MDNEKIALCAVIFAACFVALTVLFTANAGDKEVTEELSNLITDVDANTKLLADQHTILLNQLIEIKDLSKNNFDASSNVISMMDDVLMTGEGPLKMTAKHILNSDYALIVTDDSREKFRVVACSDTRCFGEDS